MFVMIIEHVTRYKYLSFKKIIMVLMIIFNRRKKNNVIRIDERNLHKFDCCIQVFLLDANLFSCVVFSLKTSFFFVVFHHFNSYMWLFSGCYFFLCIPLIFMLCVLFFPQFMFFFLERDFIAFYILCWVECVWNESMNRQCEGNWSTRKKVSSVQEEKTVCLSIKLYCYELEKRNNNHQRSRNDHFTICFLSTVRAFARFIVYMNIEAMCRNEIQLRENTNDENQPQIGEKINGIIPEVICCMWLCAYFVVVVAILKFFHL